MIDLSTKYLGLDLKNPVIAGSSGLTNSLADLIELEKAGASAIVLKSLFEEEIRLETEQAFTNMSAHGFVYPETMEYFDYEEIEDTLTSYLKLIQDAKKNLSIPVIASVNAVSSQKWTHFAKRMEDAGADAIELNAFILPSNIEHSHDDNAKIYFEIIEKVKKEVSIPVALKMSYYFSNLAQMIQKLSQTEVDALVLFNRFYSPDFDIDTFKITSTNVLSDPKELSTSLRWIAIMSGRVDCDLSASTGVHDGKAVVKQLLAGANTVQVTSALYRNGHQYITDILDQVKAWMQDHEYSTIKEFSGMMSQGKMRNPAAFERVQFMKNFRDR